MSDSKQRRAMKTGVKIDNDDNDDRTLSSIKTKQSAKRKIESEKNNSNEDVGKKIKLNSRENQEIEDDHHKARRDVLGHCSSDQRSSLGSETFMQDVLSEALHVPLRIAYNIANLFDGDCTIPFIARYRKELTNSMDPDKLRLAKETYENVKTLKCKASAVVSKLKKVGKLTPSLNESILNVKSADELDHIYAPFKEGSKRAKAEVARSLGLEEPALSVLFGKNAEINFERLVDAKKDGLKSAAEVMQSVRNIIADVVAKDPEVLEYLRTIQKDVEVSITSAAKTKKNEPDPDPQGKFQTYHDFKSTARNIQPHQILALNRGESVKALSVKYTVSDYLSKRLKEFCWNKWMRAGKQFRARDQIFEEAFNDSYSRLITPFFLRRIRTELNTQAESTAIENFALNLRNLLLTSPVRGCPILGIDPGFRNGCKVALVAVNGGVLWTTTIYQDRNNSNKTSWGDSMGILKRNMVEHNCALIALGNGTGCREIESDLSKHISEGFFSPELDVQYTIVNERGASIYSCTALAKQEFPNTDQNIVSAIYIARCLQDPMSELVKIEPKHLGVGMYQHDVPEKKLNSSLDEIVSECVSFAGVDINVASSHLLKRVAGLSAAKAANIIEWREKNGFFCNRDEIKLVKGIGPKTYEQCAGFVKIIPETANLSGKKRSPKLKDFEINLLDKTVIHPESYNVARKVLEDFNVKVENMGSPDFIEKIKKASRNLDKEELAKRFGSSVETISLIMEEFQKKADEDYRSNFAKPVFKRALASIRSLSVNNVVNGYVTNVTSFGAFVDIGVGVDGLVHISKMRSVKVQVGQRLRVGIISVDVNRNRIGLNYLSHIQT